MEKKQILKTKNVIEGTIERIENRPPNNLKPEEYRLCNADWDNYDDWADYPDATPSA
ncbi:MAG: hypothetical protein AAB851_03325 [Patescibacteria group bacterium]